MYKRPGGRNVAALCNSCTHPSETLTTTAMPDPIAETDAIFARAYASAIKNKYSLDFSAGNVLFLSPLVQRGISGGDLTYQEVTNFLTYRFADGLLNADDPSFLGSGVASYIQDLRSCVSTVLSPLFYALPYVRVSSSLQIRWSYLHGEIKRSWLGEARLMPFFLGTWPEPCGDTCDGKGEKGVEDCRW